MQALTPEREPEKESSQPLPAPLQRANGSSESKQAKGAFY